MTIEAQRGVGEGGLVGQGRPLKGGGGRELITTVEELRGVLRTISDERAGEMRVVAERYAMRIPRFYVEKVLRDDPGDPLWDLALPGRAEMGDTGEERWDAFQLEGKAAEHPRWVQKYRYEVLIRTTNFCSGLCRYCYLKNRENIEGGITHGDIDGMFDQAEASVSGRELREVVLSGGDPLTIPGEYLEHLGKRVERLGRKFGKRVTVTVHTREPVWCPGRVTGGARGMGGVARGREVEMGADSARRYEDTKPTKVTDGFSSPADGDGGRRGEVRGYSEGRVKGLLEGLRALKPASYILHVVHPREVTSELLEAMEVLVGLAEGERPPLMMVQHPLFRGVNDDHRVITEMYDRLDSGRVVVKPYYLIHPFPDGTLPQHRLTLKESQLILRGLASAPGTRVPLLTVPTPMGKCVIGPWEELVDRGGYYLLHTKDGVPVKYTSGEGFVGKGEGPLVEVGVRRGT